MLPLHEELKKVPLIFIVLPLIIGILFQDLISITNYWVFLSTSIILCILLLFLFLNLHKKLNGLLYLMFLLALCIQIGIIRTNQIQEKKKPSDSFYNAPGYVGYIEEIPSLSKNKSITLVNVIRYRSNNEWITCDVHCQITVADTLINNYLPGKGILITGKLKKPQNFTAGKFDYSNYLHYHGIDAVGYLKTQEIQSAGKSRKDWKTRIALIRYNILSNVSKSSFKPQELSVLNSLVLGYRGDIDPELKKAYASAGVAHVLSVSGMHVGIVYLFLLMLFSFLDKTPGNRILKSIIIILCIWFYAFLTGYSPPVLRSALMFSFLAIADISTRKFSSINILAGSAIVLLIVNPYYLFDPGFQLSYCAMLGIFIFYTPLSHKWRPEGKIAYYIYSLILISLAAQIGTLPLTLHYFQQFPVYFILSNLLVIPLSGLILYTGIIYMMSLPVPIIASVIAFPLKYALFFLNYIITNIENLPGSTFQCYYNVSDIILIALLIISLAFLIVRKQLSALLMSITVLLAFSLKNNFEFFRNELQTEIKTSSFHKAKVLSITKSRENAKFTITNVKNEYSLYPSKLENIQIEIDNSNRVYISTSEVSMLLVGSSTNYNCIENLVLLPKSNKNFQIIQLNNTPQTLIFSKQQQP